jgi:hypothetical protein
MAPEEPGDVIWMRPEHAATGRPAQRSRAEITAAAVTVADREGLDAVSMRRSPPSSGPARRPCTATSIPGRTCST